MELLVIRIAPAESADRSQQPSHLEPLVSVSPSARLCLEVQTDSHGNFDLHDQLALRSSGSLESTARSRACRRVPGGPCLVSSESFVRANDGGANARADGFGCVRLLVLIWRVWWLWAICVSRD